MCHDISGLLLWLIKQWWIGQCYGKHILVRRARLHTSNGPKSPSWEIKLTEDDCFKNSHRTKPIKLRPAFETVTGLNLSYWDLRPSTDFGEKQKTKQKKKQKNKIKTNVCLPLHPQYRLDPWTHTGMQEGHPGPLVPFRPGPPGS